MAKKDILSEFQALRKSILKKNKKRISQISFKEKLNLYEDEIKVDGLAWKDTHEIIVEKKLGGYGYLSTSLHEVLHLMFPDMKEKDILKNENILAHYLWQLGYRKSKKFNTSEKIIKIPK